MTFWNGITGTVNALTVRKNKTFHWNISSIYILHDTSVGYHELAHSVCEKQAIDD